MQRWHGELVLLGNMVELESSPVKSTSFLPPATGFSHWRTAAVY